jgi:hypothetical protein
MAVLFVKGYKILIDDEHLQRFSLIRWSVGVTSNKIYFSFTKTPTRVAEYMHRIVANPPNGMLVDHINGNTLDNRKMNLRVCTHQQNIMNSAKRKDNSSGYKGVHRDCRSKRWIARVTFNQKKIHIGLYDTPMEAHEAYCQKASELFGEFYRPS